VKDVLSGRKTIAFSEEILRHGVKVFAVVDESSLVTSKPRMKNM
jgi:hypothetical protein